MTALSHLLKQGVIAHISRPNLDDIETLGSGLHISRVEYL